MINTKSKTLSDVSNGAISSCFVGIVTQPLNVVRTSMMTTYIDGKVSTMKDIIRRIAKDEGFFGFYRGFVPSMMKTITGSAIYFGSLEFVKDQLHKYHIDEKLNKNLSSVNLSQGNEIRNISAPAYKHNIINFFSAAIARTIQSTLVNPILVVKTRFEVVGFNSYTSVFDAFRKILKEEGIRGYFKGLKQTLIKDVPYSAIFYSLYEFFKKLYTNYLNNLQLQAILASISANFILITITNPIDVIRARIQYQHYSKNPNHNYKGVFSGMAKIAKDEGVRGLCAGVTPRFIKKAIGSSLVWTSYETLKKKAQMKREKDMILVEEDNNKTNNK